MRRNEITPELIELSKLAKELGFPQSVEEGDWYYSRLYEDVLDEENIIVTHCGGKMLAASGGDEFLILSFSRCLEWLRERRIQPTIHCGISYWMTSCFDDEKTWIASTIHELGAKAVVKILEGKK